METFQNPELWIEAGAILALGVVLLTIILGILRQVARRAQFTRLAFRPIRITVRWAGIIMILGALLHKIFGIYIMTTIAGGLALVAIGLVAVWSLLSHITSTLLLLLLRPFRIQDWVSFPGEDVGGKVVDLNLFFTLLDNGKGEHFIIPNNLFFQKPSVTSPKRAATRSNSSTSSAVPNPRRPGTKKSHPPANPEPDTPVRPAHPSASYRSTTRSLTSNVPKL